MRHVLTVLDDPVYTIWKGKTLSPKAETQGRTLKWSIKNTPSLRVSCYSPTSSAHQSTWWYAAYCWMCIKHDRRGLFIGIYGVDIDLFLCYLCQYVITFLCSDMLYPKGETLMAVCHRLPNKSFQSQWSFQKSNGKRKKKKKKKTLLHWNDSGLCKKSFWPSQEIFLSPPEQSSNRGEKHLPHLMPPSSPHSSPLPRQTDSYAAPPTDGEEMLRQAVAVGRLELHTEPYWKQHHYGRSPTV